VYFSGINEGLGAISAEKVFSFLCEGKLGRRVAAADHCRSMLSEFLIRFNFPLVQLSL
jgi:hypothetical protein